MSHPRSLYKSFSALRMSYLAFKKLCQCLAFYVSRYEFGHRSFSEWATNSFMNLRNTDLHCFGKCTKSSFFFNVIIYSDTVSLSAWWLYRKIWQSPSNARFSSLSTKNVGSTKYNYCFSPKWYIGRWNFLNLRNAEQREEKFKFTRSRRKTTATGSITIVLLLLQFAYLII